jgi:tetratricopeptide (TPR) repeat protein
MKSTRWLAFVVLVVATVFASAQTKVTIPAGSPEDKALQAISAENDVQKRIAMLEDFVQKYASSRDALAFGNWQLAQTYQGTGDLAKALAYGDKALAAMPDNLDILVSQASVAQQMKDDAKVVDYATRGGAILLGAEKQPRPEGMSDDEWAAKRATDKAASQQSADFLEAAAYNVISAEQAPKARMQFVERFTQAFPESRFLEPVMTLAIISLQQMNDMVRMAEFGDKVLAANPNSLQTLTVLANAFAEDQKGTQLAKAGSYARKAIELTKADGPDADPTRRITAGFAHEVLGYVLLREERTAEGINELKTASNMLKDDPAKLSIALYRLGYGYAKLKNYAEARRALTECTTVDGPFKEEAAKLLNQVNAAAPKK